jgi:alpha-N-arabinofuranosidase
LRGFPGYRVEEQLVLGDRDIGASNTAENPKRMCPQPGRGAEVTDGHLRTMLPLLSWKVLRLGRRAELA